jgi:hypothetical protein
VTFVFRNSKGHFTSVKPGGYVGVVKRDTATGQVKTVKISNGWQHMIGALAWMAMTFSKEV